MSLKDDPLFVGTQCGYCEHLLSSGFGVACGAFPGGIPPDIEDNLFDHRRPHPEQEGPTVLEFRADVPRRVRQALGAVLDARHRPATVRDPFGDQTRLMLAGYAGAKLDAFNAEGETNGNG